MHQLHSQHRCSFAARFYQVVGVAHYCGSLLHQLRGTYKANYVVVVTGSYGVVAGANLTCFNPQVPSYKRLSMCKKCEATSTCAVLLNMDMRKPEGVFIDVSFWSLSIPFDFINLDQ